jgi:hypothetical protein
MGGKLLLIARQASGGNLIARRVLALHISVAARAPLEPMDSYAADGAR